MNLAEPRRIEADNIAELYLCDDAITPAVVYWTILGLREDQPAREPKGKTLAGRCGAPGLAQPRLGRRPPCCIASVVVLTLAASYGIGRLFGVSHHLDTLKRRCLRRGHRWQLVHDRPKPGVGFGLKAAVPSRRDEIVDSVIAGVAQGPHQGFRLVEMASVSPSSTVMFSAGMPSSLARI
jgi:hypothetical protein